MSAQYFAHSDGSDSGLKDSRLIQRMSYQLRPLSGTDFYRCGCQPPLQNSHSLSKRCSRLVAVVKFWQLNGGLVWYRSLVPCGRLVGLQSRRSSLTADSTHCCLIAL